MPILDALSFPSLIRASWLAALCLLVAAPVPAETGSARPAPPAPAQAPTPPGTDAPEPDGMIRGTVVETHDASRYTYVVVQRGAEKLWVATLHFRVRVGDSVAFPDVAPVTDFFSPSLGRKLERLYLVPAIRVEGHPAPPGAPPHPAH